MNKYGLIGKTLVHSFSQSYFTDKFAKERVDAAYYNFNVHTVEDVFPLLNSDLLGLNVTIPYKEKIIPFLDKIETTAFSIGAVNTIKFTRIGKVGFNTDIIGFEKSLLESSFVQNDDLKSALILGTGGASKAINFVLEKLGYKTCFISRKAKFIRYEHVDEELIDSVSIIVNTTPLGTYPNVNECPSIPYEYLNNKHLVYDLIYNPKKTLFLKKSEAQGATLINGLRMLEIQAEASWNLWTSDAKNNFEYINCTQ